ncbi:MAG: uroporphyrinogen-III synthase [bacterium]|nr:uroporphyrinogen-III synthase [bacterium]
MRVLLVRADGTPDLDARALAARGADVTSEAFIRVRTCTDSEAAQRARDITDSLGAPGSWLVLTSAAGIRALDALIQDVGPRLLAARATGAGFAAVGPTSAHALHALGLADVLVPSASHTASGLLDALSDIKPGIAVLPRSNVGDGHIADTLEARGWTIVSRVVYETTTVAERPGAADPLAAGAFDALVLRSPSAARAVAHFGGVASTTAIVAGGPTTALAASRLGLRVSAVSVDSQAESIAAAVMSTAH